jgi:NADPH2:quinone reductase
MSTLVTLPEAGAAPIVRSEIVGRPTAGQVRVRHGAIGLGTQDVAGVVDAVGPDAIGFVRGDRVAYHSDTVDLAEMRLIDVDSLVGIPSGVSDEQAAAFLSRGVLARTLVKETHPLGGNEVVLVQAAAGIVGSLIVAWAKSLGATVIATVGTVASRDLAVRAGADSVFVLGKDDVPALVRELTGGAGADVVYDGSGMATLAVSSASVRPGGTLVAYGASVESSRAVQSRLVSRGATLVRQSRSAGAQAGSVQQGASDFFLAVRGGAFDGLSITGYPISDAARALDDFGAHRVAGPIVVLPTEPTARPVRADRRRADRTALAA